MMLHPTSLLLCALSVVQTLGFAFISTPHCLAGQGRPSRSVESQQRIPRRTYERQQYWGGRPTRKGGKRAAATAFGDQGEDTAPARTGMGATEAEGGGAEAERICVLGGGFGGLYAALRLQQMPWRGRKPIVTLVDKRDKFTFLPLLYEFAMGNAELDEVAPTFRELLEGSGVSFVQACVDDVDLAGKKVSVVGALSDDLGGFMVSDKADQKRSLKYDKLVVAVGAEPAPGIEKIPGAKEHAIPFYSIEDSYRVKQAIRELKARSRETAVARVVVVGGSYGGVELACNLATELGATAAAGGGKVEVTLAAGSEVLSAAAPGSREAGLRRLGESGVRVLTGTRVGSVKEGGVVVLQGGKGAGALDEEVKADLLVWTAGSQPSRVVASLDVPKDPQGRVRVDRCLQVVGGSTDGSDEAESSDIAVTAATAATTAVAAGVYCLGDIAAVQGLDLPCNAQVAMQQSDYIAYNIWADKERRRPLDFRFVNLGEMMNLGGLDGSVSTLGGMVKLTGKAAGLARRAVYAVRMPTNPQRLRAAASAAAGTAFSVTSEVLDMGLELFSRDGPKQ